jgi:hypothetical protein
VKYEPEFKSVATLFAEIGLRITQTYDFQCTSEYIFKLSFIYMSVLSAPVDLCEKFKFYVLRLITLSGVP